jgi:hypothetical protein
MTSLGVRVARLQVSVPSLAVSEKAGLGEYGRAWLVGAERL